MLKKMIFCLSCFLLMLFLTINCKPASESFGLVDYFNILFCNTSAYLLYGMPKWDIINLSFYYLLLIGGICFLSERTYTYSRGFHAMVQLRCRNCVDYLLSCQKVHFIRAATFISCLFLLLCLSVLMVDAKAFIHISGSICKQTTLDFLISLILYAVKMILLFHLFEIWLTYFILEHKFEWLLMMSLFLILILLAVDNLFELSFITFTLDYIQFFYVLCYFIGYIFSFIWICINYRKKEF